MAYKKKSWTEKLYNKKNFPKILEFEQKFPCAKALEKWGAKPGDSVVLVPPLDVNFIMKNVPKGKLITIYEICKKCAEKYNVDFCCSLTTGIFINIVAHAAKESIDKGDKDITPYWRTLKTDGFLNPKFPGGEKSQKKLLENEGFNILQKGKKFYVENYENFLLK